MYTVVVQPFTRNWKNINNGPQDVCFFLQDVAEDLFINLCSTVIQHIHVCLRGYAELRFSFEYRKNISCCVRVRKWENNNVFSTISILMGKATVD